MAISSGPWPGAYGSDDTPGFLALVKWVTSINQIIAPMDFPNALYFLMKERKMTVEELEEKSLLSARTIKRLRNDPDYNVTREHIVALSVGLALPPIISMTLLNKAGLTMKNTMLHNTYNMILCSMYEESIETVNGLLVSLGMPLLTKLAASE